MSSRSFASSRQQRPLPRKQFRVVFLPSTRQPDKQRTAGNERRVQPQLGRPPIATFLQGMEAALLGFIQSPASPPHGAREKLFRQSLGDRLQNSLATARRKIVGNHRLDFAAGSGRGGDGN